MNDSLLGTPVRSRAAVDATEAYSGAWIEKVELVDGTSLVLKHLPATGDWLTRATGGLGRTRALWDRGLFGHLEPAVEHGILDVAATIGHDVVVMRDLSDRLWPAATPLHRRDVSDALAGLARLHQLGERLIAEGHVGNLRLCPEGARYRMFAPGVLSDDDGPNPHPARDRILAGWEAFAETVDADILDAVDAVHRDPDSLGRRLAAACRCPTILHGDAKPENLGVTNGRLTAIDWGELTGVGAREVDVAWFAVMSTRSRLDVDPDEVFTLYEQAGGSPLDPVMLDLTYLGSLAQMGFYLAAVARDARQPATRHTAATRLAWWVDRVRVSLERAGPP